MKNPLRMFIITAALSLAAQSAQAEELPNTQFKYIATWANLSLFKKVEKPFWTKEVTEKSGGRIKVTVQPFTELGLKGAEVFRLMRSGVIDIGSTVLSYVGGEMPEAEAIDLAGFTMTIDDAHKVSDAYKSTLGEVLDKKYGVKLLAVVPYHAQVIFCAKPITGMDSFKGLKVRTYNRSMAELVSAMGGTPVNISFGEVVPALQKGVADCAITGALSGNLAKWTQVTTHLYPLPVSWAITFVSANKKFWNKLDPAVQKFLQKELASWEDRAWESGRGETDDGITCSTGGKCIDGTAANLKLVPVSKAELARLRDIMKKSIVPAWAKRCGADCVAKWNASVGKSVGVTAVAK